MLEVLGVPHVQLVAAQTLMTHEDGDAHVEREKVVEEVEVEVQQEALVRHTPYLEHVVATRQQPGFVLL